MKDKKTIERFLMALTWAILMFAMPTKTSAQSYSKFTSYTWDNWCSCNWKYYYSTDGWVYAYPFYDEPRNFYFRYKYSDLGLCELSRQTWKTVKQNNGWVDKYCTFEYYITDECQTMKSCLEKYGYPCAKYYVASGKPSVLRSEYVTTKVHYAKDNRVKTLNFLFSDGSGLALGVEWKYSGNNMTYSY